MKLLAILLSILLTSVSYAQGIPVLEYHQVVRANDGIPIGDTVVTINAFSAQMKWLHDNGYTTLTSDELVAYMRGELKTNKDAKIVVLSFDDGWANQKNTLPILKQFNYRGTFNIIASYPNMAPEYMSWNDIRALVKEGHDVESHSMTHPQNMSEAYYYTEIALSKVIIEQQIKKKVSVITWPNGYFNPTMIKVAREANYRGAMSIDQDWCQVANKDVSMITPCSHVSGNSLSQDPFYIKRFYIDGRCTVDEFGTWIKQGHTSTCSFEQNINP